MTASDLSGRFMTDDNPRIFRNLEKTAGRDGFDTIVRAAVASYAALQRPTDNQARDFGRLALPLFDRTDGETRRILAASLSSSPKVPRALVERLLEEPVEISAPFLLASPLLTSEDLARLSQRRDPALKRLLTARHADGPVAVATRKRAKAAVEAPMPAAPEDMSELPPVVRAPAPAPARPAARQTALLSAGTPAEPEAGRSPRREPADAPPSVDETREMLRRLALLGRTGGPREAVGSERGDLLSLAVLKDRDAFYAALSQKLSLDPAALAAIEADEGAERLAMALKAAGVGKADAMTILMMIKPRIGTDVAAFEEMEQTYAILDAAECAAGLGVSRRSATPRVRHQPQYSDVESLGRQEARPTFGRRKQAPPGRSRLGGES